MSALAYRREIDGLRAIAVLAVVLYHLDAGILPGGFAGVDVFFVLSGYLITSLLAREWRATGRIDLIDFYARRVRRLLPALLLVVGTVLLLSVMWLGPLGSPFHLLVESVLASVLFVANEYFLASAGDYFAGPSDQLPLLHLWSLAVEEQFYLFYPLLLGLLLARGARAARWWLLVLSLSSLLLAEYWLTYAPERAFYSAPARLWELALGALVALSPTAVGAGALRRSPWLAASGLVLILGFLAGGPWNGHFPGAGALPPVLGTAMVLRAIHVAPGLGYPGAWLSAEPMVRMGLWSYAFYLWHWPLLALDRATSLSPSPLGWRAGLCVLALVLAALTHRFVEQPVRRGWRWPARRTVLAGGLGCAAVLGVAHGLDQLDLVPPGQRELVARTVDDRPRDMDTCHYAAAAEMTAATPPGCARAAGQAARLAIWGDSHALAMRPFAEVLASRRGTSVQPMTMDACPPSAGPVQPNPEHPRRAVSCDERNRLALSALLAPGAYDTVVLGGRWSSEDRDVEQLESLLRLTLSGLSAVPEVILVASVPVLRHPAPACIAGGHLQECSVPRPDFEASAEPLRAMMRQLAGDYPNLTVIDPTAFFCDERECPVVKDGYGLYWDDDHVSSTAARTFGEDYLANPARYTLAPAQRRAPTIGQPATE